MSGAPATPDEVGVVLGHQAASSQSFEVGVVDGSSLEVDDLVAVTTPDPAGQVTTYGIVAESYARLEGASLPSDTAVIAAGQMPGELVRTADVQVVRVEPERWIAAHPGLTVRRASGVDRAKALYEDTMERTLAIGLARDGLPVKLDLDFLDGTKGGHVSISGISGVATKTSTALALVRLLLEHPLMRRRVRVLIFNVKGEDLMHIDRPNRRYADRPDVADLDRRWQALGLVEPGPFPSVGFWAPPQPDGRPSCDSRHEGVRAFGWTPLRFALEGLLRFCFAEAADMRNQLSFVEERVRAEPARRAVPVSGHPGALGLLDGPAEADPEGRRERLPSELAAGPFADLRELGLDRFEANMSDEGWASSADGRQWLGPAAAGTTQAFLRRLRAAVGRLKGLIRADEHAIPRGAAAAEEPPVAVVHLTPLHQFAQRFVVGTLLAQTFEAKAGGTRDPIEFVVLDELEQVRAARGPVADQGHAGGHRPARPVARRDPGGRPAAGLAGGLRGHPERGGAHLGPARRGRGRAGRVRLAHPAGPRAGAAADAGQDADQPAQRAGVAGGRDPVPAVGDHVRGGLPGPARRRGLRPLRVRRATRG